MSESENNDNVEQTSKHEIIPKKRIRHRKKQLYENILKQMEFYFSDANLSKDRYLGDLVATDPYVPLAEFLKFNKLRAMTQDVNDIVKAMKYSTFLELSEDKLKVKRKTPMIPYDADLRTVYVESIPVTASRDWLERVFSDYGQVAYISLPKFKNSNKVKGFGFIEFVRPQDAQKCIKAFTEMGCKLPTCMPPDELSSIKMFAIEEKGEQVLQEDKEYEPPKKKSKKSKEKKINKSLDLKLGSESDSERRIDTPTDTEEKSISVPVTPDVTTPDAETPTEENKSLDKESKEDLTSQDESKNNEETPRKKKAKKRLAKEKGKIKNSLDRGEAPKGALWGLQVLSKSEWKLLRNKYLNLQRKHMKELKQRLHEKRWYSGIPAPAAPSVGVENVSGVQEMDRAKALLERIPGVFVKESLSEPCLDIKLTKRTIRTNIHVLHVEVKEGQTEAVIRFNSAKAADEYCANSGNRARVLLGAEEKEQWTRAENALSAKRTRGRAKLLARSNALSNTPAIAPSSPQPTHTHIRFDE